MHCYSIDCLGSSGGSAVVKEQLVWPKQQGLPGRLPGGKAGLGWVQDPSHRNQEMQTPKWKGGESYGGDKRKWKRLQRSVWRGRDGSDVAWGVAITHNGPWSSRSMWTCCSRSGSRCWTSTFGPQPADPEPQRQPGDISNLPQGPSLSVPLETWSRRHAPFSD